MGDEEEKNNDVRYDLIRDRVIASFPKIDEAKWDKAVTAVEDAKELIQRFLDDEDVRSLVIPDSLKVETTIPSKIPPKGKILLFVKLSGAKLENDAINNQIVVAEIGGATPFEHLELLANEIFLPILSNPQNQAKWGEVPTREIMDRFHNFLSSTTILCGQIKGETRLPMPPIDLSADKSAGKNRISLLEGAIITWTKQIRSVLKQDPESQLKLGMHPTPDFEIEFWKNKAANLNSIYEQLQGPKIRRVLRALDKSKSTYCSTFAKLCKEVFTSRLEANDNTKYLRTLEVWFASLNGEDDFPKTMELFKPVLHIILLIWKNSKHYNTPNRLVVLMREICNSLIAQATKYVSGEQIFAMIENKEAGNAVTMLKTTLHVCGTFKSTYTDYKTTANAECPMNPWKMQNNALFMRLDSFLERCHDILDLTQTIVQFSKLANIEVGGTKGSTLTSSIKQIYDDFLNTVAKFKAVPYDIMDVGAKAFDDDFYEFRCSIKELERRLGAVVSLAFDDCTTVYGRFKLLDSFEGLLERPIIQDELEKKYVSLVQAYGLDLKIVQELFLAYRDACPISWNLPPIAGALTWCRGLVSRIEIAYAKLSMLEQGILIREEAKEVQKVYSTIMGSLKEFETQKIEEWGREVELSSHAKLKLPLLVRNAETRHIVVNFDPALVRLLREVKYFLLLGLVVPATALEIYQQVEVFRKWTGKLDMIVQKNNDVLQLLLPVERPLVKKPLKDFDDAVEKGLGSLNWRSPGVNEFIDETTLKVDDLYDTVLTMKNHLTGVNNMLEEHNESILTRKPKPMPKDEFDKEYKISVKDKYAVIKDTGKHIHSMVKDTNKVLKAAAASPEWLAYVYFINNVVVDGLAKIVYTSLENLFEQIDSESIAKNETLPMIEIKLDLVSVRTENGRVDEIQFVPTLESNNGKGIRDLINGWIGSFFNISTQFKRLDNNGDGSYLREIHNDYSVKMMLAMINETLEQNEEECLAIKQSYDELSYLWLTNMDEFFEKFKVDNMLTLESNATVLDLAAYEEEIKKYSGIRESITQLPSSVDKSWLRINTDPARGQLINWANKWVSLFRDHLQTTLVEELTTLNARVIKTSKGLDIEVVEGEAGKEALMQVMENVRDVREFGEKTKSLFKPLNRILLSLKGFGVDLLQLPKIGEDTCQDYLDSAPLAWESVEKKMYRKKEDIMPIQLKEVEILKETVKETTDEVRAFRNAFRNQAPFAFSGTPAEAYAVLDEHAGKLVTMEDVARKLNQREDLFELVQTKYTETNDTRTEIKLLKYVWDTKALVLGTFEAWNETAWNDIEVEPWQAVTNSLMKNLKSMGNDNPVVKGWKVYRDIEEEIKNMQSVLDKVLGLHSPAMRERHWKELAKVCKVKSIEPHDPKFSFESVVKLKLYEHGDDIDEITETAAKELKIERKLTDIEKCWRQLEMDYVPFKADDEASISLIKPSEDVIENLEGHSLELGGMIGMGKFVDYFRDRVENWQKSLGLIEDVLKVWSSVSRAWGSLQSIFMESADIRTQLPEDTKIFEGLNSEFEELSKAAVEEPNVLQVCSVDGRYDSLVGIQARLDKCQKSLNDYLDQKKKIFPRFYFVSNVALLDMLANGTNPPRIMKYLGDCFDSLNELIFVKNEDGTDNIKLANEMIAKDGERCMLVEEFALEGEVERYLTGLTENMRMTLRDRMKNGYDSAATWDQDNPREMWLSDIAAQVVVTSTQMYWTEESELALDDLSGGQEDAVKKYYELCDKRLKDLIRRVLTDLERNLRTKIITIITLDVHARDVIEKLVVQKVEGQEDFLWAQQLRFYWMEPITKTLDCEIRICDYKTKYFYEWIGNTGRLVITPLTDRCYVTLTMGLRLFLGGAPAGPAGTGKTETTKDLARALALPCYVFNCSDQMNYQTMADIFRGLAQVGCWGCFDEFNRISIEVLSVVATQVKQVQDCVKKFANPANRDPEYQDLPSGLPPIKVGEFFFEGDTISLTPTCGFFITMNPGYAGRTELPENLKVLFRSCAMIRPDLKLICENMLMSEGFELARSLSVKFVTLYELSSELLSKQAHYDWGLRAVKSVLRVAGALKRGEPGKGEEELLMRALRDFNTPKIPEVDTKIFLRLIADLFMGMEVEPQVNENLRAIVEVVAVEEKLQKEKMFVLKVLQFQELLDVRHSVMLLGPTGSGKTCIWRTLAGAHNWDTEAGKFKTKKTCIYEPVNPKAVNGDELYGFMTLAKDWKDGVLSIIMRGMAKNIAEQGFHEHQTYKWVVLDGDIDAIWIESMNTVMDDNKVLTLVSNERIPLSAAMRMVFEINSLKNATPATVSRAGILYINESDVGWRPFTESYWKRRVDSGADPNGAEKQLIMGFYDKYIENMVATTSRDFKECTPLYLLNKISTLTYILDALIETVPFDDRKNLELMDNLFCFSMMWAFGGSMIEGATAADDSRKKFNEQTQIASLFNGRFPKDHPCYDYYLDIETNSWQEWHDKVPEYTPVPIGGGPGDTPFSQLFVPTSDTVRMTYLMNCLQRKGRHVMLVGSGSGKTSVINQYLGSLDKQVDGFISTTINMSYFTDSKSVQADLELPIDKRSGRRYGPPASTRLIVFIDDMNLPYIETYGTQNSIALLTQHMSYSTIFDREDLGLRKELVDMQYIGAMNPTAGSFVICERAQRLFATFSLLMPSRTDLTTIFNSLYAGHVMGFSEQITSGVDKIVDASLTLYEHVSKAFLPSAKNFTYNWNLREMTNVFQGVCMAAQDSYETQDQMIRLWIHECARVFSDRFFELPELDTYHGILIEVLKKQLGIGAPDKIFEDDIVYTNFANSTSGAYLPITDMDSLRNNCDLRLQEYNESNAMMDLVLFQAAAEHIARISRIISNPGGNAMLIGVGGSGKQSLSRLASFIMGFEVKQLQITSNFKVDDLLENFREIFKATGVKGIPTVFLMTDTQVVNEKFLIYINAILASGWISGLFLKEDIDAMIGSLRNEAKSAGIPDLPDTMLKFLIDRVRTNLHVILCFSPVGDTFRVRARRFPALIYNTAIDFFHPWPRDALISVAEKFLEEVEMPDPALRQQLAIHMADEHLSVTERSVLYQKRQGRFNYVTPKSFLELISFYSYLLELKRNNVMTLVDRLDVGLSTLRKTAADVAELQIDLNRKMVLVEEKVIATNLLLEEIGVQRADADVQQEKASVEAAAANEASAAAAEIQAQAELELSAATPAMEAAAAAVDCLNKAMLTELKNFTNPPTNVDLVTTCCLILVEKEYKNHKWDRAKKMMANVDAFKRSLQEYKAEDMTEEEVSKLEKIFEHPDMNVKTMEGKSMAAANLCNFVLNTHKYNRIWVKTKPLMDQLDEATASKNAAEASLAAAQAIVDAVNAKLAALAEKFEVASAEKAEVEAQAEKSQQLLGLAERLVGGLESENVRWGQEIEILREAGTTLIGDCMLAAGFVSYVGAFDQENREALWKETWIPDLVSRSIPMTDNVDPLNMLTTDGKTAKMISEGLPADRISIENGSVITNCKRWPLLIDPQVQGIKWIRQKEEENGLEVFQLNQKNWIRKVEAAMTNGNCIIVENLGQDIDATLDPVLSRAIYKRGRSLYIKFGGEEVEYDPKFQLYLQTKLSNPHYKPEIAAQCTLINFIATERGLEDQLLAKVVGKERPELEATSQELTAAFQRYKIELVQLEDDLLERLANAPEDILSDVPLIEGLEATKKAALEIKAAIEEGKKTEVNISVAREIYRPVASEGAMLYFLLTKLCSIEHMYQFSLDSFVTYFYLAIDRCAQSDKEAERVLLLKACLRLTIYTMVVRGLFVRHKLIFLSQLTFTLMKRGNLGEDHRLNEVFFQFLLRGSRRVGEENTIPWLSNAAWETVTALGDIEEFSKFPSDIIEAAPRFREWYNAITPENEKLPLDWSSLKNNSLEKMLVVRTLRPDRVATALTEFVRETLPDGNAYADCDSSLSSYDVLEASYLDSSATVPIYFILSPGANVMGDMDKLATKYGFVYGETYHQVSMGQGQDKVAEQKLDAGNRQGHWIILNNVHLMPRWLVELEKRLDEYALAGSHEKFRIFLSSDASNAIPIGILNRSIKITNEPPAGLKANIKRAFASLNKEAFEEGEGKMKSILFGLCHFHAVMLERKQYGPMGYNMMYPFSIGDLRDSSSVLSNYMENNQGGKIPWNDLKYIFGEIMYGGHIVNDFDRLLCNCYLDHFMKDELLDETEMFPFNEDEKNMSFMCPAPTSYDKYVEHIDFGLTQETPVAFGLHPNAEIDFRTTQSNKILATILELQSGDTSAGEGAMSPDEIAKNACYDIADKFEGKFFILADLAVEEKGPYQNVFIQEMTVLNTLITEIMRSLNELKLGFAGQLTMSDAMDNLKNALFMERIPPTWQKRAWPSMRALTPWLSDFFLRYEQLDAWFNAPMDIPKVTWLSGLVNPQSFLTAICQVSAQASKSPLDSLVTWTEITKKFNDSEVDRRAQEGAYIKGMFLQGCRWDTSSGLLEKSKPKEMFFKMPIVNVKALSADKADVSQGYYVCPCYKTEFRGPTYVFCAQLKTKSPSAKW